MLDKKKIKTVAPLAIFAILVLILVIGLHHGGKPKFAQHIGDVAPALDLPVLDGSGARIKNWRGQPYLVNFFASWCADCRVEHEELMTLQAAHVTMIGVAYKDKLEKTSAYLDQNGNPFVAVAADENGRAFIDWGLTGVPETFAVDARGIIRWHHIGALTDKIVGDELMPVWETMAHGVNK